MARQRKTKPPTPEKVKAMADALSQVGQMRLHHLFMIDPNSVVGKLIRTHLALDYNERSILERRLGIAPGQIDEQELLTTVETDKEAKKRTGLKSTNAVKTARYKARKKIEEVAVPPRSLPLR
jgi:hypothetical protein